MTVTPMAGTFVQAAGYSTGRNSGSVDWAVVHSAEGSKTVSALGNYFAGTRAGSSNAGIDDNTYGVYVTYNNTPWTNPPINSKSDTLELCAFRAWSREEWLKHNGMLEQTAHWLAWRCAVRGLPIRLITGADAVAGKKGILDHKRVNDGFHKSTHSDVGPGFPWDVVILRAQKIASLASADPGGAGSKTPEGDLILGLTNPPMHNQSVANWQNVLRVCGNDITIDGVYGQQTADLTDLFKANRGINERGVASLTWAAGREKLRSAT